MFKENPEKELDRRMRDVLKDADLIWSEIDVWDDEPETLGIVDWFTSNTHYVRGDIGTLCMSRIDDDTLLWLTAPWSHIDNWVVAIALTKKRGRHIDTSGCGLRRGLTHRFIVAESKRTEERVLMKKIKESQKQTDEFITGLQKLLQYLKEDNK